MSSPNNTSGSGNKSGSFHNRYVVPAATKKLSASEEARLAALSARVAAARASVRRGMAGRKIGHIPRSLQRSSTFPGAGSAPAASGSKNSIRANNGSKNSSAAARTSDHIRRGPVYQLPRADKLRKISQSGPGSNRGLDAVAKQESAAFREALTKDSFPPLVPRHFLKSDKDCKMNAGSSSFANTAAKGCKPGAKYSPRSPQAPDYSWPEKLDDDRGLASCGADTGRRIAEETWRWVSRPVRDLTAGPWRG